MSTPRKKAVVTKKSPALRKPCTQDIINGDRWIWYSTHHATPWNLLTKEGQEFFSAFETGLFADEIVMSLLDTAVAKESGK